MEIDDDVELIKQKVLKEIKPINFEDELDIDDILGQKLVDHILPDDPPILETIPVPVALRTTEITPNSPKETVENTVCHVCSKNYTTSRNLKKHFAKHTGRYFCPVCKKIFARKETQLKHIPRCKNKSINDSMEKRKKSQKTVFVECCKYYCEECSKSFTRRENYDHHMMIHQGVQVVCEFCQKRLSSFKSYQRHKKLHEHPQQKISCEDCPTKFSLKSNLRRHIKLCKHKSEKICIKCNSKVKTETILEKHRCQDTIYSCSLCSQVFCFEVNLRSHLKKEHPNLWFKCKRCPNTSFMTRATKNLQEHVKKLHSIHLDFNECFQEGWFILLPN
ncbi:telomere zinc finger-associated protein-like [Planococcus citri]|uniref:telomere zinc finger-associated protein-like n=1 Tax=Planococcus citri TaxID=170843 RepID=UPI0031F77B4F